MSVVPDTDSLNEQVQPKITVKNNDTASLCNEVFLQYLIDEFKNNPHLLKANNINKILPKNSSINYIDQDVRSTSGLPEDVVIMAITNHIRKKTNDNGTKRYHGNISQIPFSKFIDDEAIESIETQCNFITIIGIYKKLATAIKCFEFNDKNKIDPIKISECIKEYFTQIEKLNVVVKHKEITLRRTKSGGKRKSQNKQKSRRYRGLGRRSKRTFF